MDKNVEDCAAFGDWLVDWSYIPALSQWMCLFRYFVDNGMLQIMNVNLSDQGIYTCIARTNLDEDNATALLTVLGKIVL